jgi:drug/metabolite transporter (DMT)-like permease
VQRGRLIGGAAALGAMVLVGTSFAAADALRAYPAAGGQAVRYVVGAGILLLLAGGRVRRPTRRELLALAALAAIGLATFNLVLLAAVREADAGSIGVVVSCVPVLLAVLGPLLERRPVRPRVLAAAVVVSAGAAAVQWAGGRMSAAGLGLALILLAGEAAFSLIAVPLLRTLGPLGVSVWACALAVPMLVAFGLVVDGPGGFLAAPGGSEAAALAYMAVAVTAGAFSLWYTSVAKLGVERAGLFAGAMPVSALLGAAVIGASSLTPWRLVGAVVVGIGVTVGLRTPAVSLRARRAPRPRPAASSARSPRPAPPS